MGLVENIKSNIYRFTPNQKTFMVIGLSLLFIGLSVIVYGAFCVCVTACRVSPRCIRFGPCSGVLRGARSARRRGVRVAGCG